MFDCPDPTQTSPTKISFTVIEFFPAIVISAGPPGFNFASFTIHLPSAPAVADFVCPSNFTVTFSPGSAVPQTGTTIPFCNTAWSLNSEEGLTSARAATAA